MSYVFKSIVSCAGLLIVLCDGLLPRILQAGLLHLLTSLDKTPAKVGLIERDLWVVSLEVLQVLAQNVLTGQRIIYCSSILRQFNLSCVFWMRTVQVAHRSYIEDSVAVDHRSQSNHYKSHFC